jgi:uncharacterized protein (TIGR02145 family)
VYGSNYPPVGEYIAAQTIKFMGTPPFDLVLSSGSATAYSDYNLLSEQTLESFTDKTGAPGIISCDMPGSTVNFTAFNPCPNAAAGSTWSLADTREVSLSPSNPQTYTVKLMADGRYWMVQDMKFGNKCRNNSFSSGSSYKTGAVTTLDGTWYGNCTSLTNGSTPSARGYLYDWAAAINKQNAYYGGSEKGCSSTAPDACQGICPVGWHIPTGASGGEFYDLHYNYGRGCSTSDDNCWNASSDWEGVLGGYCDNSGTLGEQGEYGKYWSSTYGSDYSAYYLTFYSGLTYPGTDDYNKYYGRSVRCVRNY